MSKVKSEDSLERRCKNYVYCLLKYRDRSEKEIRDRLTRKKFKKELINKVIEYFIDLGYIDDRGFAQKWTQYRLKVPFGLQRIKYELRQKGIDSDIISEIVRRVEGCASELEALLKLAVKKKKILESKEKDKIKAKSKLYQFLLRRGFSSNQVSEVLEKLNS